MLIFLAVIAIFAVITAGTPGSIANEEVYQCRAYATALSLLPPVIAIGLALIT